MRPGSPASGEGHSSTDGEDEWRALRPVEPLQQAPDATLGEIFETSGGRAAWLVWMRPRLSRWRGVDAVDLVPAVLALLQLADFVTTLVSMIIIYSPGLGFVQWLCAIMVLSELVFMFCFKRDGCTGGAGIEGLGEPPELSRPRQLALAHSSACRMAAVAVWYYRRLRRAARARTAPRHHGPIDPAFTSAFEAEKMRCLIRGGLQSAWAAFLQTAFLLYPKRSDAEHVLSERQTAFVTASVLISQVYISVAAAALAAQPGKRAPGRAACVFSFCFSALALRMLAYGSTGRSAVIFLHAAFTLNLFGETMCGSPTTLLNMSSSLCLQRIAASLIRTFVPVTTAGRGINVLFCTILQPAALSAGAFAEYAHKEDLGAAYPRLIVGGALLLAHAAVWAVCHCKDWAVQGPPLRELARGPTVRELL